MTRHKETGDEPLRVVTVLAASVRVGDWLAGGISPDAPTTPVQPIASAWHITAVRVVPGHEGEQVQMASGSFGFGELTPHAADSQCLVIRGLRGELRHPRADVVYAGNVRTGDWFAGWVHADNRESPVRLLDAALPVTGVLIVPGNRGGHHKEVLISGGGCDLPPQGIADQCLVIRG